MGNPNQKDSMKAPLWEPSPERKGNASITRFIALVNERYGTKLTAYNELNDWAINNLACFWALAWEFVGIRASKKYDRVEVQPHRRPFLVSLSYVNATKFRIYPELLCS